MLHDVTHAGDVLPLMLTGAAVWGITKGSTFKLRKTFRPVMRQRVVFRRVIRSTFGVITVSEQIQNKRAKQGVNSPENVVRRAPLIAHCLQFMGWFVPQLHQRLAIFITH